MDVFKNELLVHGFRKIGIRQFFQIKNQLIAYWCQKKLRLNPDSIFLSVLVKHLV
jgi:hypothetical protein